MINARFAACIFASLCTANGVLAADSCKDAQSARTVMETFKADVTAITDQRKVHEQKLEDEINVATDDLARNKQWTQQQKIDFIAGHLSNAEFVRLEEKKLALLQDNMSAVQQMVEAQQKGDVIDMCRGAVKAKTVLEGVGHVHDQQYALMLKRIHDQ